MPPRASFLFARSIAGRRSRRRTFCRVSAVPTLVGKTRSVGCLNGDRAEARAALAAGRARDTRLRAKLSQPEVAQALGVSASCVSRWEAGVRIPRGDFAERLARLLRALERAAGSRGAGMTRPLTAAIGRYPRR